MPPSRLSPVGAAPETAHDPAGRDDPLRLLALVEQRDDRFEVMQPGSGFPRHEFAPMDAAVAFVLRTGPRIAQERTTGEPSRCQGTSWAP